MSAAETNTNPNPWAAVGNVVGGTVLAGALSYGVIKAFHQILLYVAKQSAGATGVMRPLTDVTQLTLGTTGFARLDNLRHLLIYQPGTISLGAAGAAAFCMALHQAWQIANYEAPPAGDGESGDEADAAAAAGGGGRTDAATAAAAAGEPSLDLIQIARPTPDTDQVVGPDPSLKTIFVDDGYHALFAHYPKLQAALGGSPIEKVGFSPLAACLNWVTTREADHADRDAAYRRRSEKELDAELAVAEQYEIQPLVEYLTNRPFAHRTTIKFEGDTLALDLGAKTITIPKSSEAGLTALYSCLTDSIPRETEAVFDCIQWIQHSDKESDAYKRWCVSLQERYPQPTVSATPPSAALAQRKEVAILFGDQSLISFWSDRGFDQIKEPASTASAASAAAADAPAVTPKTEIKIGDTRDLRTMTLTEADQWVLNERTGDRLDLLCQNYHPAALVMLFEYLLAAPEDRKAVAGRWLEEASNVQEDFFGIYSESLNELASAWKLLVISDEIDFNRLISLADPEKVLWIRTRIEEVTLPIHGDQYPKELLFGHTLSRQMLQVHAPKLWNEVEQGVIRGWDRGAVIDIIRLAAEGTNKKYASSIRARAALDPKMDTWIRGSVGTSTNPATPSRDKTGNLNNSRKIRRAQNRKAWIKRRLEVAQHFRINANFCNLVEFFEELSARAETTDKAVAGAAAGGRPVNRRLQLDD